MKQTIHLLLSLSLITFLSSSCSQKGGKSEAQIQLFSGQLAISAYTGGTMIWGSNKSGTDAFARALTSGNFAIELNNGVWDFIVIGWDGAAGPMTGTPSCATATGIKLEGKEINVSLSLSNTNCNSPLISQHSGPGMGINTFPSIKTQTCNQRATLDGVAYCDGAKLGAATSIQPLFPEYDKVGGNLALKATGLSGPCLQTIAAPAEGDEGKSALSANIPTGGIGSSLFTIMRQYLGSQDCQSSDTTGSIFDAQLPNGLAAPTGTRHFYGNQTLTGTAPFQYYTALLQVELSDSAVCSGPRLTSSTFASGKGDAGRPHIICNHHQLDSIGGNNWSSNANKHFALGATIDYFKGNGITLDLNMVDGPQYPDSTPLGNHFIDMSNESLGFSGSFNGRGHKIIGFQLNTSKEEDSITDIGFVRKMASGAIVQDIIFVLPSIEASTDTNSIQAQVGTVAGTNEGLIHKVRIIEGSVDGYSKIGGIAGINNNSIHDSSFQGEVSGADTVGGLAGEVNNITGNTALLRNIFNGIVKSRSHGQDFCSNPSWMDEASCTSNSETWYSSRYFGGVTGKLNTCAPSVTDIDQIAVHGNIEGTTQTGGLVGGVTAAADCNITNSYVTANISGDDYSSVAGLIGSSSEDNNFSISYLIRIEGSTVTPNGTASESYNGVPDSPTYIYIHGTEHYNDLRSSSYYSSWPITGGSPIYVFDDDGDDFPRLSFEPKRFCSGKMAGTFAGGTGTANDPYLICTREQFQNISTQFTANKYFKLMRNIDFYNFAPGGAAILSSGLAAFAGTIDGNNFSATNFDLTGTLLSLIYKTAETSKVKNLAAYAKGISPSSGGAGTIVYENHGVLENVRAHANINNSTNGAGCIAYINNGVITGAKASCKIDVAGPGRANIGGIAGINGGLILYSEFDGQINIAGNDAELVGGISGKDSGPTASGSYYDPVSSQNISKSTPKIYESTFRGLIALNGTNTQKVGGIIGDSSNNTQILNNTVDGTIEVDITSTTDAYEVLGQYDANINTPDITLGPTVGQAYIVTTPGIIPLGIAVASNDVIYYDGTWMKLLNGFTTSGKPLIFNGISLYGKMPKPQYIGGIAGLSQGGTINNNFSNLRFNFIGDQPALVTSTWGSLVGDFVSTTFSGNLAFYGMLNGDFNNDEVDALASYGMAGGTIHTMEEVGTVLTNSSSSITSSTNFTVPLNSGDMVQVSNNPPLTVDSATTTVVNTLETVGTTTSGTPIYLLQPINDSAEAMALFQTELGWDVSEDSDSGTIWAIEGDSRPHLSRADRADDSRRMPYYINLYNQYR